MTNKSLMAVRVELSDVPDAFEKKGVAVFACTGDELVELAFSRQHVRITLVSRKIDCQSDKLFTYDWFGTMDNKLVNQWDAVGIGEGGFCFVFETQMIQKLNNLSSEPWRLQSINQLRNHTSIIHLNPNFLIK